MAHATLSNKGLPPAGSYSSTPTQQPSRPVQPLPAPSTATINTTPTATQAIPPLHTLSSLLQPPPHLPLPSPSYACSIFAVTSWCSRNLTYPSYAWSPFPPKRHIKIQDPSIVSRHPGITLAVYDSAGTFKPKVGTVTLFRGVVMQRWENEVILNAYARRADRDGDFGSAGHGEREWYVDDEERLIGMGHDFRKMKDWWAERSQGREQKRTDNKR